MLQPDPLYRSLAKLVWLFFGVVLALWFLQTTLFVVLFTAATFVFALGLNAPVRWLERRRVPRGLATTLVVVIALLIAALVLWIALPRFVTEVSKLVTQLPAFVTGLANTLANLAGRVSPSLADEIRSSVSNVNADFVTQALPTLQTWLARVGSFTVSLVSGVGLLALLGVSVVFSVAQPRPLVRGLIAVFPPELRRPAMLALASSGQAVAGWLGSNLIVGAFQAVTVGIVLSLLGVPGALVWALLAFFSELVPRVGFYVMAVPPLLVALAVGPQTALWVGVFFLLLDTLTSNFVGPFVRADRMDLHPVSLLLALLAFGTAFGFAGAILATPVAGIIKAFYEAFVLRAERGDVPLELAVDVVLDGKPRTDAERALVKGAAT
ncbi:AI-2E family transporter [Deinococcus yavapaiensis]|uniref:Putative PurR-regulated permease PerM n=1 Tax=Deinococcus yavapaiensis KR-236 TaxID=694435 RepID=A0A318S3W7_9DEIO|nr:AI-2E family transporter [Deinococcus yavapaiensis]PYE53099.1 putative PurR-regulated permease PerM [Deinococcus yavapaiensis KR-236]